MERDWKYKMELGKILLTEKELSLMKKSNISLTEVGSSVDNFKEVFVIPLAQIKKSYSIKVQGIYIVKIETRDGHPFSITMANDRNIGKNSSEHLSELINSTTLLATNVKTISSTTDVSRIEQDLDVCRHCGENIDLNWNFCKNCGKEI